MWAICELKTNYALKHTYQLRGICELTSETYFHVALAERCQFLKAYQSYSDPPPPPPAPNPHLLGNCLLLDSLLPSPGIFVTLRGGGADISGTTSGT